LIGRTQVSTPSRVFIIDCTLPCFTSTAFKSWRLPRSSVADQITSVPGVISAYFIALAHFPRRTRRISGSPHLCPRASARRAVIAPHGHRGALLRGRPLSPLLRSALIRAAADRISLSGSAWPQESVYLGGLGMISTDSLRAHAPQHRISVTEPLYLSSASHHVLHDQSMTQCSIRVNPKATHPSIGFSLCSNPYRAVRRHMAQMGGFQPSILHL
jgi:hypothetical protein